jgi:hypothetical protein
MNREQIIQMAREAGLDPDLWNYTDAFERFAKLVAEHEREACAKVCEEMRTYIGRNNAVIQSSAQDCASAIRARGQA